MEALAIFFTAVSGVCLVAITIRAKLPMWGGIVSKAHIKLDKTDKKLASVAAVCFVVGMGFLLASF